MILQPIHVIAWRRGREGGDGGKTMLARDPLLPQAAALRAGVVRVGLLLTWCMGAPLQAAAPHGAHQGVADAGRNAASRPNILLCVADDASYAHFGADGCRWVRTPVFDRLAGAGVLFRRAYTPNAKCAPSRAAILTGRNPWQLGAAANHLARFPADIRTFTDELAAAGYMVGFTGKGWAPGDPGEVDGKPRLLTGQEYNAARLQPPTSGISARDYAANFAQFLANRQPGRPFFFWFGSHEPHRPYEYGSGERIGQRKPEEIDRVPGFWPDQDIVRQDMLDYGIEVEYFDRQVGALLSVLEQNQAQADTLVIITSDNGMPFPRVKGNAYELAHHLPLVIAWADARGGATGRIVDDFVSLIDLAPTITDFAGLGLRPARMLPFAGLSLRRYLEPAGATLGGPARDFVLVGRERNDVGRPRDQGYPIRGIGRDGFLYLRNFAPERWPAGNPETGYLEIDGSPTKGLILRENRDGVNHWMWELNFGYRPSEELYDLDHDPDCIRNLARDLHFRARIESMASLMNRQLQAEGDPRLMEEGDRFDDYPVGIARLRHFYERMMAREPGIEAEWTEPSDVEPLGFDPEKPARNKVAP